MFWNISHMAVAFSLDDVNMSISSIYLVKNMHDGQINSTQRSSWSYIYRRYIHRHYSKVHYTQNRCSEVKNKITHTAYFINTLRNNDYLTPVTRHLNNKPWKVHGPSNTCFLKLPHFSEIFNKEIRRRKG